MSLEQIEAKLSACCKKYQPVLLYGKRTIDVRAFVENIRDGVSMNLGYIDCNTMDGEEFYNELARYHEAGCRTISGSVYSQSGTLFIDNLHCENEDDKVYYRKAGKIIRNRKLTILSASPHFDPIDGFADNNDVYVNYESYAVVTHYDVDWIVAYTDKPNAFPSYFRRQFEVISLDSESDEGGQQEEDTVTEYAKKIEEPEGGQTAEQGSEAKGSIEIDRKRQLLKFNSKEAKVEPKQIELFELLWENKDKFVDRNNIGLSLWPDTDNKEPISPIQIDQQINKLRGGIEKLEFKKEIIETIRKTQLNKGGYIFHSNLTSFLKK
ncbi:MAG: winged helix-turn-helix domain-containing protein [Candidatus Scalindua sp.]